MGNAGTPLYASPEQVNCKESDYRSDIYSLGIHFEEDTGKLPKNVCVKILRTGFLPKKKHSSSYVIDEGGNMDR